MIVGGQHGYHSTTWPYYSTLFDSIKMRTLYTIFVVGHSVLAVRHNFVTKFSLGLGHIAAIVIAFFLLRSFFSLFFAVFLCWFLGAPVVADGKHAPKILFRGFAGFVANWILFFAAARTSTRFVVLALTTSSLWMVFLGWFLLGERSEPWPSVLILLFVGYEDGVVVIFVYEKICSAVRSSFLKMGKLFFVFFRTGGSRVVTTDWET